jgi:hypothetical protein
MKPTLEEVLCEVGETPQQATAATMAVIGDYNIPRGYTVAKAPRAKQTNLLHVNTLYIAHKFEQPPGSWHVGQVEGQVATGADKGKFKVKYKGQRNFEAHELLKADYGVKNVWVILVPPKGGNDCAQLL